MTSDGKPITSASLASAHKPKPMYKNDLGRYSDFQASSDGSSESAEKGRGYVIRMSRGRPVRVPVSSGENSEQQSRPTTRRAPSPYMRPVRLNQRRQSPRLPFRPGQRYIRPTYTRGPSYTQRPYTARAPYARPSKSDESSYESGRYIIRMSRGRPVRVPVQHSDSSESSGTSESRDDDSSQQRSHTGHRRNSVPYLQPVRIYPTTRPNHYTRPIINTRHQQVTAPLHNLRTDSSSSSSDSSDESGNYIIRMSRGRPVRVPVTQSSSSMADHSQSNSWESNSRYTSSAESHSASSSSGHDCDSSEDRYHSTQVHGRQVFHPYLPPIPIYQPTTSRPWQPWSRRYMTTMPPPYRPPSMIITTTMRPIRTRPPRVHFTSTRRPVRTRPPREFVQTRQPPALRQPVLAPTRSPPVAIFSRQPPVFTKPPVFVPESSSSESSEAHFQGRFASSSSDLRHHVGIISDSGSDSADSSSSRGNVRSRHFTNTNFPNPTLSSEGSDAQSSEQTHQSSPSAPRSLRTNIFNTRDQQFSNSNRSASHSDES